MNRNQPPVHADAAVQRLIDLEAISTTIRRYALAVDLRDGALLRTLFSDDARAKFGDRDWLVGGDVIAEWIERDGATRQWQHHLMSVCDIDLHGDEAAAVTYQTSHIPIDGHPHEVKQVVARYFDDLRREGGMWKITSKRMDVQVRSVHAVVVPSGGAS